MVVVCPVCRDLVQSQNGYILSHGVHYHGKQDICAGSFNSSDNIILKKLNTRARSTRARKNEVKNVISSS